jgi:hypothetical protein
MDLLILMMMVAGVPSPSLTGRVVSSFNQQPIAGVAVQPLSMAFVNGHRSAVPAGEPVVTDQAGQFRIAGLRPGEYLLEFSSETARTQWIGIEGPQNPVRAPKAGGIVRRLVPYTVSAEPSPEPGFIMVTETSIQQITGEVRANGCEAGMQFSVQLIEHLEGLDISRAQASIPCNAPFRVSNVPVGNYRLAAWSVDTEPSQRRYAEQDVLMGMGNRSIVLEPR